MLFRQRLLRLLFWQYKWSTNLLAARTVPLPEQAAASSYLLILGELKGEGWYKIVILIALESLNLPYYWVFCWKSDFRGWIYLQSLVKTPETGVFDADEEAEMDQALLAARCLFWEYGKYPYKRHRLWRWVLGFFCSGWSSYCKTNVRPQIRRFGRGFGISHEWHLYIYMIYPIIHHSWWFHPTFFWQVEPVSLDGVNWAFASQAEVVGPQAWKVTPPAYLPPWQQKKRCTIAGKLLMAKPLVNFHF